MDLSEPVATLLGAIIGLFGGISGTYFSSVLPERRKRPGLLLANFLDNIAADVGEMIAMFEKEQIPHTAGHALESEIELFARSTTPVSLGPMAQASLLRLKELSKEAETVDLYLYQGEEGKALRDEWITKAKGIVGELRGEAAKMRVES
jgi:hypothetical protein